MQIARFAWWWWQPYCKKYDIYSEIIISKTVATRAQTLQKYRFFMVIASAVGLLWEHKVAIVL